MQEDGSVSRYYVANGTGGIIFGDTNKADTRRNIVVKIHSITLQFRQDANYIIPSIRHFQSKRLKDVGTSVYCLFARHTGQLLF